MPRCRSMVSNADVIKLIKIFALCYKLYVIFHSSTQILQDEYKYLD